MTRIPDEFLGKFLSIASQLSPENLHCDGEISLSEARKRERQLRRDWHVLELALGRKVSEDQVWTEGLKAWRRAYAEGRTL
jgi:hypothetical protein